MKQTRLTENTVVSLSLIGLIGGGVLTGVVFVANLGFSNARQDEEITSLKTLAKERREARAEYEKTVAVQLASIKADVSIVDTRLTIMTEWIQRALEENEQRANRGASKGK